jgi:biotin carboxyl carrier protein
MTLWLDINGRLRKVELPNSAKQEAPTGEMTCLVDGRPIKINAQTLAPGILSLLTADPPTRQFRCILDTSSEGDAVLINGRRIPFTLDDPRSLRTRRNAAAGTDGPKAIKAPMSGRIVRVLVNIGDEVTAQQGLIVIEAMKMQNELKSPKAGRIVRVAAREGETVQSGDILVIVE